MAIMRATFSGLLWSNNWNNVVHFAVDGGSPDLAAAANHFNNNWVEKIKAFQHNQLQWLNIQVRDVSPGVSNAPYNLAINKVGTSSAATSSDSNLLTVVLRFYTAMGGRKGRGRILIAGVPQGRFNLGVVWPDILLIWQGIANDLAAIYAFGGSAPYALVVAPRSNPANFKDVVNINVRATQGTCRSRGYGIGT